MGVHLPNVKIHCKYLQASEKQGTRNLKELEINKNIFTGMDVVLMEKHLLDLLMNLVMRTRIAKMDLLDAAQMRVHFPKVHKSRAVLNVLMRYIYILQQYMTQITCSTNQYSAQN